MGWTIQFLAGIKLRVASQKTGLREIARNATLVNVRFHRVDLDLESAVFGLQICN